MNILRLLIVAALMSTITSCESEEQRLQRELAEERARSELQALEKEREETRLREAEEERLRQAILDRYKDSSLSNGSTPYKYCYGKNLSCQGYGCSEIKVISPFQSDVMVLVKSNGEVTNHAYIKASRSHTFQMPNGTYQVFFYYGKGSNPDKVMKETTCGTLKGGFVLNERVTKDFPQPLENVILEYELIIQTNGNFNDSPSSLEEAL